jgi:iron complex outermembrane recepter protein
MKWPILLALLLMAGNSFSQKITGMVKDEHGNVLSPVSITLQRANDSSIIKITITNSFGVYEFVAVQAGTYFLTVSHTGYALKRTAPFETTAIGDVQIPGLVMQEAVTSLKEVTVTSKKPLIEVKADKTILNVEGSINAVGLDALELLRKSPGVLVDRDDNISLAGKNGVQIYIDGRPSPLTGKDLSEYLKSLNSNSIEAIEIITNPSARYDASGNAGIINIRLKKEECLTQKDVEYSL